MFRGIHNINLDAKGRLAIPTKYRSAINDQSSGNMIITVDPGEKCLLLYPLSSWNDIEKQFKDKIENITTGYRGILIDEYNF